MRMLTYVFETTLEFSEPVTDHSFVLRCLPKSTSSQMVMESQVFTRPRIPLSEQVDGFGNRIVVGYCPAAHESFDFCASGMAMVDPAGAGPSVAEPMYGQFTPLTYPSDEMKAIAKEVAASVCGEADQLDAYAVAQALCSRVYQEFTYEPGATTTATTAAQAFASRKGVCQDYSHVFISLCRCLGLCARYVTGLMVGEGATHAWVEVHDGVRWRGFDPTNNKEVDDCYLLFSTGRDFEDCPIERGVFRGNAEQTQKTTASLGVDAAQTSATGA